MPPEQAIGAVDQIGKPSDVFGLGAILCVILTGKPPYVGADAESNRQLAARAKLDDAFARLDAVGAEPELIASPSAASRLNPRTGPRTPARSRKRSPALRADSERRARQAEMDRARAEVKNAEERKRRRVKYALALSVLGLLAVASLAAWWVDSVRSARRSRSVGPRTRAKDPGWPGRGPPPDAPERHRARCARGTERGASPARARMEPGRRPSAGGH